jgi:murein DD-endopeptidase MepM/ murein hydrolase activator NlpD
VGSLVSFAAIVALGAWGWHAFQAAPLAVGGMDNTLAAAPQAPDASPLPPVVNSLASVSIRRFVSPHTDIPERTPSWLTTYTVERGDTVYSIAQDFDLMPESILWGNAEVLQDDPNLLKPGTLLNILPTNGLLYRWQEGDSLDSVASEFHTSAEKILEWPGNGLNPLDPTIDPGTLLIVPGGSRPFKWEQPVSYGGQARTYSVGPGKCVGGYSGVAGSDAWGWPTTNHNLSGYDFSEAHKAIDIQVYIGQPIYSSQAGVVVFAGESTVGYGLLVIVDHLNGWHTFYAHLSQWNVSCGQQVYRGTIVGLGGSTGNSTGPHLHFEMRYNGVGQNPWGLLP